MLKAALAYAGAGFKVFPLRSHGDLKAPHGMLGKDAGYHLASNDVETVEAWWRQDQRANIGLALAPSGLIAVDGDVKKDGLVELERLEQEHGALDRTAVALTGGGGLHILFRAIEVPATVPGKLARCQGIDVKYNGYIVVAPSLHESGRRYRWERGRGLIANAAFLSPVPAWVIERRKSVVGAALDAEDWTATVRDSLPDHTPEMVRRKALAVPAADAREPWLHMGFALQHYYASRGMADEGLDVWIEWSSRSLYFDPDECERIYASMGRNNERGITARYLLKRYNEVQKQVREEASQPPREHETNVHDPFGETDATGGSGDDDSLGDEERPDTPGDVLNGVFFADRNRGRLVYVAALRKWYAYQGGYWVAGAHHLAMERAEEAAAARYRIAKNALRDAAEVARQPEATEMAAAAYAGAKGHYADAKATLASIRRLENMLAIASTKPGMRVDDPSQFDADPMLLGVANGVVDLRTGTLRPLKPTDYMTKRCLPNYRPSAKCPRFMRFLDTTFNKDQALIDYIQRALGYTLTGRVTEEVLFFAYGTGANGKSVLTNIVEKVMGEYARPIASDILKKSRNEMALERATVPLIGKRLILVNEVAKSEFWDDQRAKELVSSEPLPARFLYAETVKFRPTHKFWIRGNHKPNIGDESHGLWRRFHLIGFEHEVKEKDREQDLTAQIVEAESEGVLAWMVQGCLKWQEHGIARPASVEADTEAFRAESDMLGRWISECCIVVKDARVESADAYANFREWCVSQGIPKIMTKITFSKDLLSRKSFQPYRTERARGIAGLRLRERSDPFEDDHGL